MAKPRVGVTINSKPSEDFGLGKVTRFERPVRVIMTYGLLHRPVRRSTAADARSIVPDIGKIILDVEGQDR